MSNLDINHDASLCRFVLTVNGEYAGVVSYRQEEHFRDFNHTEIEPAFRGKGLSGPLIKAALDDTKKSGQRWAPTCSAVAHFIENNPGYESGTVGHA